MCGSEMRARALFALLSSSACALPPSSPPGPDPAEMMAPYASPRGRVETGATPAFLASAETQLDVLGGGLADVTLRAVVVTALAKADLAMATATGSGVLPRHLDGTVSLEVACAAVGDAAGGGGSGVAVVQARVVDGAMVPLVWGTATACLLWVSGPLRARFDGDLVFYRHEGADVIVRLHGQVTVDAALDGPQEPSPPVRAEVRLDFRLSSVGLETRVPTATGDVIATRGAQGQGAREIDARAANGRFRCSPRAGTCEPRGDVLPAP